jgi:hypothetical protein
MVYKRYLNLLHLGRSDPLYSCPVRHPLLDGIYSHVLNPQKAHTSMIGVYLSLFLDPRTRSLSVFEDHDLLVAQQDKHSDLHNAVVSTVEEFIEGDFVHILFTLLSEVAPSAATSFTSTSSSTAATSETQSLASAAASNSVFALFTDSCGRTQQQPTRSRPPTSKATLLAQMHKDLQHWANLTAGEGDLPVTTDPLQYWHSKCQELPLLSIAARWYAQSD